MWRSVEKMIGNILSNSYPVCGCTDDDSFRVAAPDDTKTDTIPDVWSGWIRFVVVVVVIVGLMP